MLLKQNFLPDVLSISSSPLRLVATQLLQQLGITAINPCVYHVYRYWQA
jgi:hypothetical protein